MSIKAFKLTGQDIAKIFGEVVFKQANFEGSDQVLVDVDEENNLVKVSLIDGSILETQLTQELQDKINSSQLTASNGLEITGSVVGIADNGVINRRIADNSISLSKMQVSSVDKTKLTEELQQEIENAGNTYSAGAGLTLRSNIFSIGDDQVVENMLAAGSVSSGQLQASCVGTSHIASNSVTNEKIINYAITGLKISNSTITSRNIAKSAVSTYNIENGAVTSDKISSSAVIESSIANGAVTQDKLNTEVQTKLLGVVQNWSITYGISNECYFVKHENGIGECFGNFSKGNSNTVSIAFPFTFLYSPAVTIGSQYQLECYLPAKPSTTSCTIKTTAGSTGSNTDFSIHIIGRWR